MTTDTVEMLQLARTLTQEEVDERARLKARWDATPQERFEDQAHHHLGASAN